MYLGRYESDCLGASKCMSVAYNQDGLYSGELFGLSGMLRYR
jgi:hypothetical protein